MNGGNLMRTYLQTIGALLLWAALLAGCGEEERPAAQPLRKTYEAAGARLSLELSATEVGIADPLTLRLSLTAPERTIVTFPEAAEGKIGEFTLRSATPATQRLSEKPGEVVHERTYVLDPFLAGDYTLPALEIKLREPAGKERALRSEELPIRVNPAIAPDEKNPALRDITGVEELPRGALLYAIIAAAALALIIVALLLLRRKKTVADVRQPLPHEVALARLEALLGGTLLKNGHYKEFYLEMSDILRAYIEDGFGLAAPERTTEEFLDDLRGRDSFNEADKALLKRFLVHCDMVKFARHTPAREEISGAVQSCRDFITGTSAARLTAATATGTTGAQAK